jgi:hypothetical protein
MQPLLIPCDLEYEDGSLHAYQVKVEPHDDSLGDVNTIMAINYGLAVAIAS